MTMWVLLEWWPCECCWSDDHVSVVGVMTMWVLLEWWPCEYCWSNDHVSVVGVMTMCVLLEAHVPCKCASPQVRRSRLGHSAGPAGLCSAPVWHKVLLGLHYDHEANTHTHIIPPMADTELAGFTIWACSKYTHTHTHTHTHTQCTHIILLMADTELAGFYVMIM